MTARSASALVLTFGSALLLLSFGSCSQITRVPPGHSIAFSMAPKPEVISTPTPPPSETAIASDDEFYYIPPVEPELPTADFSLPEELASVETATSYATQGSEYLAEGNNSNAIEALKKAVELEPGLSSAWRDLATAYEKANEPDKASQARENFKRLSGL